MSLPTLKSLLNKRGDTTAWLQNWVGTVKASLSIVDITDSTLFSSSNGEYLNKAPILLQNQIIGYVKGDHHSSGLANLLSLLLEKEAEKKKLGTEVLNLYQELNVIYNFSEKLADSIEPDVIAKLTLEQTMHSIPSDSGVIVLWDELNKQLVVPAFAGESLFDINQLKSHKDLLLAIGMSGQSEIMNDISVLKNNGIIPSGVNSVIFAAMKVKHRIMGAIILAGKKQDQYSAAHLKLLVTLALQSSTSIESAMLYEKNIRESREREESIRKIHEATKKFVPIEFINSLGKESLTEVKLGDQVEKVVTVVFTDIRDFTTISEKMTPSENFKFVSSFNERLGPVIRAHHGFINQYLGDSIMAIFPGHPDDALHAALGMQDKISELNMERLTMGLPPIKAGIGLHTGSLIMGITGDEFRLDAATISDTVNTAARIEGLTKYFRSPLLLSNESLIQLSNSKEFNFRKLGEVQLKGKNQIVSIIDCLDAYNEESIGHKINNLPLFANAMRDYNDSHFEQAIQTFKEILAIDPDDFVSRLYMNKAVHYAEQGIPENWSPAMEMLSK
ncbi:MAG: adenylate/guanylate cyclase domain-containing protein [Saprospiraceae bacterium]